VSDNIAFFSFVGMGFCTVCGALGFSVVARASYRAVCTIWEKRAEIDEQVESDFKIKLGR
jgi:hypothetical protein